MNEAIMKIADGITNLLKDFGLDLNLGSLTELIPDDLFANITDIFNGLKDLFAGLSF